MLLIIIVIVIVIVIIVVVIILVVVVTVVITVHVVIVTVALVLVLVALCQRRLCCRCCSRHSGQNENYPYRFPKFNRERTILSTNVQEGAKRGDQ